MRKREKKESEGDEIIVHCEPSVLLSVFLVELWHLEGSYKFKYASEQEEKRVRKMSASLL